MATNTDLEPVVEKRAKRNLWAVTWLIAGLLLLIAIVWFVIHQANPIPAPSAPPVSEKAAKQ
jgi:hypothetical protein